MTYSHFALGHFDYRHLIGWHFRGCGGFLLFHGRGAAQSIDWGAPTAGLAEPGNQASLTLPLPTGEVHALGARRLAASGILEGNRNNYILLRADAAGNLSSPLAPAEDLSIRPLAGGQFLLEFSHRPPAGYAQPTRFDILGDAGDGTLDPQHPIATVTATPGRTEYSCTLAPAQRPGVLGVRPMSIDLAGPLAFVPVPVPSPLHPPITL
jgi:hypothetical protein